MIPHTLLLYLFLLLWLLPITSSLAQRNVRNNVSVSSITYVLEHRIHTVYGVSRQANSVVELNKNTQDIEAVRVTVPVKSFDSGNRTRDKSMLKTTDADKYPEVQFQSSSIHTNANQLEVTGLLNFHGITKPVSFKATKQQTDKSLVITGSFEISLEEFGIKRPSVFGMKVRDTLSVRFQMVYPTTGT